jgi:hypothetical protein
MPVELDYSYPDGRPFASSTHNRNMLSVQNGLNAGAITTDRLSGASVGSDFEIKRHMIMPDQAVLTRGETCLEPTAFYGDAIGGNAKEWTTAKIRKSQFKSVGGAGIRWYQPYDATLGMLQWSFFMSHNAWFVAEGHNKIWRDEDVTSNLHVVTQAYYDGHAINNTWREASANCAWPACNIAGAPHEDGGWTPYYRYQKPYRRWVQTEAHSAMQRNHHLLLSPGLSYTGETHGVERGWHELTLKVFLSRSNPYEHQTRYTYLKYSKSLRKHHMMLNAKADFGVRGARIVTFL